jgi:hypothetical protein
MGHAHSDWWPPASRRGEGLGPAHQPAEHGETRASVRRPMADSEAEADVPIARSRGPRAEAGEGPDGSAPDDGRHSSGATAAPRRSSTQDDLVASDVRVAASTAISAETGVASTDVTRTARRRAQAPPGATDDEAADGRAQSQPPKPYGDGGPVRPEITVSIGHIEVRAAPANDLHRSEARSRSAAPFRPKVSLDDFLGEKPNHRR